MLRLLRALSRASAGPCAPGTDRSKVAAAGKPPGCCCCSPFSAGKSSGPAVQPPRSPEGASGSAGKKQRSPAAAAGTMGRLLERSRSPGELLRWLSQNPGKASAAHYALALLRLSRLLPGPSKPPSPLLEQPDFQALSGGVTRSCARFDNATLERCLRASAALGLPGSCALVRALKEEEEARRRRRRERFGQSDVSAESGRPAGPAPLAEPSLERRLEGRPQALFLLRSRGGQAAAEEERARLSRREVLRLVRRLLGRLEAASREHELARLDELLALCGKEAGDEVLAAIFSSPLCYENRLERFVRSMAGWLPGKADNLAPSTMALIAKYVARHRQREPPLLDSIAAFLLQRIDQLDSKVIQKLVFPFSRMNYRPSNHAELFPRLEVALAQRADSSPLATINILMSLFQLRYFAPTVLHKVFSPCFLANAVGSPCGSIVRRYLSLLDVAVALEVPEYGGPRLDPRYRVRVFDGTLTADKANRMYSYKGLVAEALRQLVGDGCFQQDVVLPPGYYTDFLLWVRPSGTVVPLSCVPHSAKAGASPAASVQSLASDLQGLARFRRELLGTPATRDVPSRRGSLSLQPPDGYSRLRKDPSPTTSSLSSPTQRSLSPEAAHSGFPSREVEQEPLEEDRLLPEAPASPTASPHLPDSGGIAYNGPGKAEAIYRVVLLVNDKWHYCQNAATLVGSRAMRDRHLRLLGYCLVQLPFMELEKVSGVEEAKQYLAQKLRELRF